MFALGEFDPAVDEGAFFVAAGGFAAEVGRGGFGGEEEAGYGAEGGEEVGEGRGAHEGGDTGKVDHPGFVGFSGAFCGDEGFELRFGAIWGEGCCREIFRILWRYGSFLRRIPEVIFGFFLGSEIRRSALSVVLGIVGAEFLAF